MRSSAWGSRQVTDDDVKQVVMSGELIETHADAHPFPKALFMALVDGNPLYVSCAFDGRDAYISTVHWYAPDVWIDPQRR